MGFLAPLFLAGAVAVGLPFWLHLLRRSRTSAVPFASLMFFERRTESSVSPKRLHYLMLLALRIALLLLLALAFANPFVWQSAAAARKKELVIIALDRSFSMRAADRLERAKELAQSIAAAHGGALMEAMALDAHLEALNQPSTDAQVVKAAIEGIRASDLPSSYAEFTRSLRAIEQNMGLRLNVHLVSDLQQTSMPGAFTDLDPGQNVTLTFHSVSEKSTPNWAVENVSGTMRVFDPARSRISATLAGWQAPATGKNASLLVDGKVVETKRVSVPANGRAEVEFLALPTSYGSHRGEIRIEPHDGLPADDAFLFPLERFDAQPILFISNGDPRDGFYFKTAIEADTNSGFLVKSLGMRDAGQEDLSHYAFIVVSDCGKLPSSLERYLDNYVRRGGGVLLLAGSRDANSGHLPLTGVAVTPNTVTQAAGSVDPGFPPLAGLGTLDAVQFYVASRIDAPSGTRVLAKLADGSPLVLEQDLGEGRVLTFASTLDNTGNDFPLHRTFVPFVVQTARYLAGTSDGDSTVTAGNPVELRRSREKGAAADVIGPDGRHELSFREAASAMTFVPNVEGFYEIHRASGQRSLVGVHADRRESDLTPVTAETTSLWQNLGAGRQSTNARSTDTSNPGVPEAPREKRPIWRFVLILLVGAGLWESIFAVRYLGEERSPHDSSRSAERVLAKT